MSHTETKGPTMTVAQAAEAMGTTEARFRRRRLEWEREHGMPVRLPSGAYSRAAFLHWVDTYAERKARLAERQMQPAVLAASRARLYELLGVPA